MVSIENGSRRRCRNRGDLHRERSGELLDELTSLPTLTQEERTAIAEKFEQLVQSLRLNDSLSKLSKEQILWLLEEADND